MRRRGIVFLLFIYCASCSTNRYATTNRSYVRQARAYSKVLKAHPLDTTKDAWVGTTNFNLRKPGFVVIHHTAQNSCPQTLQTFTNPQTQVSAHYVICKDGTVYHMLNDYLRAWHAGVGSWGNDHDINSSSIGIELDNNGFEPFPESQITSLLSLLDTLKKKYNIPSDNFIGHEDIAPTRKNDPNVYFPWEELAEKGFGLWYGDTTGVDVPESFDPLTALRIIGYSVVDPDAVIRVFRRHFLKIDDGFGLSDEDKKVLYVLMRKVLGREP